MWQLFQYIIGFLCVLIGFGGGAWAVVYSQSQARSSEFAFGIMAIGAAWAAAMAYVAFRLFGFS